MKRILCGLLILGVSACGESEKRTKQSESKEPVKPTSEETGQLKFESIQMDLFDLPAKSNTFRIGERMNLSIQNMTGFIARDGYYELGLKLDVLDDNDSLIISENDLYEVGTQKFPVSDPIDLAFHVDFYKPYQANKNYTIGMFVWDKVGGKHIQLSQKIKLLPHQENGFVALEGDIPSEHIITYKNGKTYTGNTYFQDDIMFLKIALAQDFLDTRPAIKTRSAVTDETGKVILESSNSATLEADAPPFESYMVFKNEKYPIGTYIFEQTIEDSKTGKKLLISYPFDITKVPE